MPIKSGVNSRKRGGNLSVTLGLVAVIAFFLLSGFVTFRNTGSLLNNAQKVTQTQEVINSLEQLLSLMKDAETGQRGFLITGNEKYLEPFNAAKANVKAETERTRGVLKDNPAQQALLTQVSNHAAIKFAELDETIALRRGPGFEAARAIVMNDSGKKEMDAMRALIFEMDQAENVIRGERVSQMNTGYRLAVTSGLLTTLSGLLLSLIVASLIQRSNVARKRRDWIQAGKIGLNDAMAGEQGLAQLGESIIGFLAKYIDAHAGVIFKRRDGFFQRIATHGVPAGSNVPTRFERGDGLLWQAVYENRILRIEDVPEGYLTVGSGLGRGLPRQILISPASTDKVVNVVMEFGFIHPLDSLTLELLAQVSDSVNIPTG